MLQCVYVDRSFISLGVSGALLRSRRALTARSMLSMIHACEQVVEIDFQNQILVSHTIPSIIQKQFDNNSDSQWNTSLPLMRREVEKRADCEREHLTPCSSHTSTSNWNLFLATTSEVRTHFWRGGSAKNTWICMRAANSMSLLTHTHCTALVHVCRLFILFRCSRTESAALSGIKKLTISLCEVALALCSASHVKIYKSNWNSAAWQAAQWIGISGTAWKKPFATLEWSGSSDFQSTNERLQENKNKNY